MRQAQAGEELAYAELLGLLTNATKRFARGRVGGVPWIDDVVQETLISVHRARHTWDPSRPFAPWFYAIASHRTIDVFRRERRVASREHGQEHLEAPAPTATTGSGAWDDVDMAAVHAALATLPARQRDIVAGLKLRDETVRGLAARHRMSESAVKVMAHRGYRRLRKLLGGTGEGRP
jgi:RNA polymerase sigma-70 factor (ECF subfamily)